MQGLVGSVAERRRASATVVIGQTALRLASWELNKPACRGRPAHRLRTQGVHLSRCIRAIFHEEFAWQAMVDVQADVQLVIKDDEEFLNAMAEFLWENRNALIQGGNG